MTIDPQLQQEMARIARRVGSKVNRAMGGAIERGDAEQEAWAWMLSHMHRLTRARMRDGRLFEQAFVETLDAVMKAVTANLAPREPDPYRYTRESLAQYLTAHWTGDGAPQGEPEGVAVHVDPSEWGNHEAGRADVSQALDVLDVEDQALVFRKVVMGQSLRVIAEATGIPSSTVEDRLNSAFRRLLTFLNGRDGRAGNWGGPGARKVISNSAAQVLTED